jgi:hypothetical protein
VAEPGRELRRIAVKQAGNNGGTTVELRPDEAGRGPRTAADDPLGFTDPGANRRR